MARSYISPPIDAGEASAEHDFGLPGSTACEVEIRFFSDAAATVPIAFGTGARDAELRRVERVRLEDVDRTLDLESTQPSSTWSAIGGRWQVVGLGVGAGGIKILISGGSNPVGAASLRIVVLA